MNSSQCGNLADMYVKKFVTFDCIKGVFFLESPMCFSNLQKKNIPKNYPELEI